MKDRWKKIADLTDDYVMNCDHTDPVLVLDVFPGGGKTTTVIETLCRSGEEKNFIYLSPTHKVIEENLTWHKNVDLHEKFVHLYSRKHYCTKGIALRLERDFNVPISVFCSSCENTKTCGYYITRREIENGRSVEGFNIHPSWAGVHAHITTYLRKFLEDNIQHYDVLVLEENPISSLMEQFEIDSRKIRSISYYLKNFTNPQDDELPRFDEQLQVFHDTIDTLNSNIEVFDEDRIYQRAVEWRDFEKEQWLKFEEAFYKHCVLTVQAERMVSGYPPTFIGEILEKVLRNTNHEMIKYHFTNTGRWKGEKSLSISYFHKNDLKFINLPIIVLDGTANMKAIESILGKECRDERMTYKYENVFQLTSGKYGVSSWVMNKTGTGLSKTGSSLLDMAVNTVKRRPGNVLLFGSSRIMGVVMDRMKEEGVDEKVRFAKYYSERSSNSYKDCDAVILLMMPNIPPKILDVYVNLSGIDEEVWTDYFISDEMIQSIARIRPSFKDMIKVNDMERDRYPIEIHVYPKKKIFHEGDIDPMKYFRLNKSQMDIFSLTGHNLSSIRGEDTILFRRIMKITGPCAMEDIVNICYPYRCENCNGIYTTKDKLEKHKGRNKPVIKNYNKSSRVKHLVKTMVHIGMLQINGDYYERKPG